MSTVKRDDELWTQEEVMEFGLGGEEEFCSMQIVEASVPFAIEEAAMVEDMAAVEETATYEDNGAFEDYNESANVSLSESSTTKSGRVRKKTAKLMEMEKAYALEKVLPDGRRAYKAGGRKSRASMSDYTIDETQAISSADAYLSQYDEKPVKIRFSLGSKTSDSQDSVVKTAQRDRRKGRLSDVTPSDADVDCDRQLVIDEPRFGSRLQSHDRPLRMKLSMSSDMTATITPSFAVGVEVGAVDVGRLPSSPKKMRKASKRTAESLSDTRLPDDILGIPLPVTSQVLNDRANGEINEVGGTQPDERYSNQSVGKRSYTLKNTDRRKDTTNIKKKRTKGYTAYMVWCGAQREKFMAQNPGIDFATVSKMLGDTWHAVPEKEKMTYRRQARKMAKKAAGLISTGKPKDVIRRPVGRPPLLGYRQNNADDANSVGAVGTSPLDCAAHLKLLGESLTTIGSRLQEHRGKIAVQGSLSVLFDSLLCVLGTLMCMTMQLPELNGCPEETHASTLSNIAYIMPGVG